MVLIVHDDERTQLPLAALLRSARAALGGVIRSALYDAGYDDLPGNGPYVISATVAEGVPLGLIIEHLRLSKQAAGHLVDVLVLRGYLDRRVDPEDRRRLVVGPTERGKAAGLVIRQAADLLEARLVANVGKADLTATRRTLARLSAMANDDV
jgi:DNA-binding MarR family transcriptional regulator